MGRTRRKVSIPAAPPPSMPPRRVAMFLGLGLVALAISAIATLVGLEIQGEARQDIEGTTDRASFGLVQTGQPRPVVIDLLGSAPRAAEAAPLGTSSPRCVVYDRRSGRPGLFRICFENGVVVSKSRVGWPT